MLDLVMFAYRMSTHSSTGLTPFKIQYGQKPRLPTHLLAPDVEEKFNTNVEYVAELQTRLNTVYDLARDNNLQAAVEKEET